MNHLRQICLAHVVLSLAACNGDVSTDSKVIHDQIGRYHFIAPSGEYPAMVFDTATGCTTALTMIQVKKTDGTPAHEGRILTKSSVNFGMQGEDLSCQFVGLAATTPRNVK